MTKYSRATSLTKLFSNTKVAATTAAALFMTLVIFVVATSGFGASGIASSTIRAGEAVRGGESGAAAQRKSGGHARTPQQGQSSDANSGQGANMTHAKGTFEVTLEPQLDPERPH